MRSLYYTFVYTPQKRRWMWSLWTTTKKTKINFKITQTESTSGKYSPENETPYLVRKRPHQKPSKDRNSVLASISAHFFSSLLFSLLLFVFTSSSLCKLDYNICKLSNANTLTSKNVETSINKKNRLLFIYKSHQKICALASFSSL